MHIEWNKVTWFSKITAIVLFVGIFFLGFWLGNQKGIVSAIDLLSPSTKAVDALRTDTKRLESWSQRETKRVFEDGVELWNSENDKKKILPVDISYGSTTIRNVHIENTSYEATHVPVYGRQKLVRFGDIPLVFGIEIEQLEGRGAPAITSLVGYSWDKKTEKWVEAVRGRYEDEPERGFYKIFAYKDYVILVSSADTPGMDQTWDAVVYNFDTSKSIKYQPSNPISAGVNAMGFDNKEFNKWLETTIGELLGV